VLADQAKMFSKKPDPQELAKFLFPDMADADGSRTWVQTDRNEKVNVAALKILFEFDSTEIKPESLQTIERLAQALVTPQAKGQAIMIEGHTDAVGGKLYNIELSKRRARSIKEHLVDVYQIDPQRLAIEGMGESSLFNAEFPNAAINRRVQIKRLLP